MKSILRSINAKIAFVCFIGVQYVVQHNRIFAQRATRRVKEREERFNIVHKSMASPLNAWTSLHPVHTRAEQLLRHNAMLSPASGACDMGLAMRVSPGRVITHWKGLGNGHSIGFLFFFLSAPSIERDLQNLNLFAVERVVCEVCALCLLICLQNTSYSFTTEPLLVLIALCNGYITALSLLFTGS